MLTSGARARDDRDRLSRETTPNTIMLRQAIRRLARPARTTNGAWATAYARAWATASESTASDASVTAFMEKFELNKTSPTMEAPLTPSSFVDMKPRETTAGAGTPDKLKLNFYLPHDVPHDGQEVRGDRRRESHGLGNRGSRSAIDRGWRKPRVSRRDEKTRRRSRARRSMRENMDHLNDALACGLVARARGETTGRTCGSFDRAVGRGSTATTGRETRRRTDGCDIFCARRNRWTWCSFRRLLVISVSSPVTSRRFRSCDPGW